MAQFFVLLLISCSLLGAGEFRTPAGTETAAKRPGAQTILPGGRFVTPFGQTHITGPGPFGIAVNEKADLVVSADGGPNRFSLTVLKREGTRATTKTIRGKQRRRGGEAEEEEDEDLFNSVFQGMAFDGNSSLFVSEGNSGRVRKLDAESGRTQFTLELNQGPWRDSYSGDLVFDAKRELLYVVDQANFRVGIFDVKRRRLVQSVKVGRLPFAIAFSPDQRRIYVTNLGMFEYSPLPGADRKRPRETGIPFPAFGFPSAESAAGTTIRTPSGDVAVAALGDPNREEANSLAIVDVATPGEAKLVKFIRTGLPFGAQSLGGSSPSGVVAAGNRVYVANGHNDSITVIDAERLERLEEIPIRVPKLENLRGVLPIGLAWHPGAKRLLVAEAGINAIGVIDPARKQVLGHIPAPWFPTDLIVQGGKVFTVAAKGFGTGPNATTTVAHERSFQAELRRGAMQIFDLPSDAELPALTRNVWANNGFVEQPEAPAPLPSGVKHVVIIVKENRTFDEVFGDLERAGNAEIRGAWLLARFGRYGIVEADRNALKPRISNKGMVISPNHIALARRFAISDNFYADSEVSVDGHHWIVGSYPNAWTESTLMAAYGGQKDFRLPTTAPGRLLFPGSNSSVHPEEQLEGGALWHHLERHNISFRNYGEGFELAGADEGTGLKPTGARYLTNIPMPDPLFRNSARDYPNYNTNIPDQFRATQFIHDVQREFLEGKKEFPRLIFIHLPNDHLARPRREDGFPVEASYMADNDFALGRIVDFLSHTKWWANMAVFITEDDAQGGVDHIDTHRTVFMALGPYVKQNYVSRVNTSMPSMLKTTFRLLGIPPLNLYDAAAQDLADLFTEEPDLTPYTVLPVNKEIFVPELAKEPLDAAPGPKMDDPTFLRRQHDKKKQ
ncbi:MAG: alkaline phosphatase family protein [Bryobacter sp.]|nr:alkaline phosphatase family protein [Bryobacter sp.]